MKLVRINLPTLPQRDFRVADLDGRGELLAATGDPLSARLIVLHVVQDQPDGWLRTLPAAIFDRLCAAIFSSEYSNRPECRSGCVACGELFDFQLDLPGLIAVQDDAARALVLRADDEGCWHAANGIVLCPPTLGDLDEYSAPGKLAGKIVKAGDPADPSIDALLEIAAPLLTLPIGTTCPHCGEAQEVGFDIARYLVASIAAERPFLVRETHLIAARYGWSHESIMALPRKDRRAYAALVESERSAALGRRSA